MNTILEILLECVLVGTVEVLPSKKVPMVMRVLLAVVLLTLYIGLFALLLTIGIKSGNTMLIVVACIVLIIIAVWVFPKVKKIKKRQ